MIQWPKQTMRWELSTEETCGVRPCTLCRSDCQGKCETWTARLKGESCCTPETLGGLRQEAQIQRMWASIITIYEFKGN